MNADDPSFTLSARRQQHERALQRRLVAHVAAGRTTDMAPAPLRYPASVYTDPARLAAEQRELFLKLPLVAGLSGDIPKPGDVQLFDGAGVPIMVVRQPDGSVAAFRNMCTHRGARLLRECGHVAAITCPFHGWSFDTAGRLAAQPGKAGFAGLDCEALNLLRVPCAEAYGLIFVKTEVSDETIDVDGFLGSLAGELALLELDSMALIRQGPLHTAGNWKYVLDTYGEGYHFAALHPDTLGTSHYSNVAIYDALGLHFRVVFPQKIYGKLKTVPEPDWPEIDSVVYVIFPNTAMVIGSPQPGLMVVQLFRIFPEGVGATRVELAVYAPKAVVNEQTRPLFEGGWDIAARIVGSEDYRIAAEAFANLQSAPAGFSTVVGRNEPALQQMQRQIATAIGMPLD